MANTHNQFLEFEKLISLTNNQSDDLFERMYEVQRVINQSFVKDKDIPGFNFDTHGSIVTNTMVINSKKNIDVDFGIYFIVEPAYSHKVIKEKLYNTLSKIFKYKIENRDKLVKLIFDNGCTVDITIYYQTSDMKVPRLARNSSWMPSDPKALYCWFLNIANYNPQLTRIVKYFKYWASLNKMKTPSGVAFSVWIGSYIIYDDRDDICFYQTAQALLSKLRLGVYCRNPVEPYDNLVSNLQPRHKKNFLKMLEILVHYSMKAIEENDINKSDEIWSKVFGKQFKMIKIN